MPDNPRKRGRPPGQPKPQKEPVKIGRPSIWPPELGPLKHTTVRLPEAYSRLIKDQEFKQAFCDLMLDYSRLNAPV